MTLQFANCRVEIDPAAEFMVTIFPDGSRCEASPHSTDQYRRTARDLGYGEGDAELMRMCLEHEIAHTLLAENRGEPYSRTLWDVAHGTLCDPGDYYPEENRVLDFQRSFNRARNCLRGGRNMPIPKDNA